jgi:hypothetical protein
MPASALAEDPYAVDTLRDIARRRVRRTTLQRWAEGWTAPARAVRQVLGNTRVASALRRRIEPRVALWAGRLTELARQEATWSAVAPTLQEAGIFAQSFEDLAAVPLARLDQVTGALRPGWRYAAVEGGAVGLVQGLTEWQLVPFLVLAAADAAFTLYLAARETALMAAYYGFSPEEPALEPHLLRAMLPAEDWAAWDYLGIKGAYAVTARQGWHELTDAWIRRMTWLLTDKELAVVVPLIGAVANATVNAASVRVQWLVRRYGADAVAAVLGD